MSLHDLRIQWWRLTGTEKAHVGIGVLLFVSALCACLAWVPW